MFASIAADEWAANVRTLVLENRDALVRQTARRIANETGLDVLKDIPAEKLNFSFVLIDSDELVRIQSTVRLLDRLAWVVGIGAVVCLLAAVFTSVMFEVAKNLFTSYVAEFDPGSFYTGTLYALVIIVFWVYYAAMIFILGGEVGQVYELRRVRRLQRETFED